MGSPATGLCSARWFPAKADCRRCLARRAAERLGDRVGRNARRLRGIRSGDQWRPASASFSCSSHGADHLQETGTFAISSSTRRRDSRIQVRSPGWNRRRSGRPTSLRRDRRRLPRLAGQFLTSLPDFCSATPGSDLWSCRWFRTTTAACSERSGSFWPPAIWTPRPLCEESQPELSKRIQRPTPKFSLGELMSQSFGNRPTCEAAKLMVTA
jgi:hypothetical protein